jgi:hypothetical protein
MYTPYIYIVTGFVKANAMLTREGRIVARIRRRKRLGPYLI